MTERKGVQNSNPVLDDKYRGVTKVLCPVHRCSFIRGFVESDATLKEPITTQARRENYLKLAHSAGEHRTKG